MVDADSKTILRRLSLDLALWFLASAIFLIAYTLRYSFSASAIVPHFRVIALPLIALQLSRTLVVVSLKNETIARAISSLLITASILTLFTYYALVIVGLEFWSRVISWELITSYSGQFNGLLEAIGISLALTMSIALAIVLLVFGASYLYVRRFDWVKLAIYAWPRRNIAFVWSGGVILIGLELLRFTSGGITRTDEPVALTVYPKEASVVFENHAVDKHLSDVLDAREDKERSAYVPAVDAKKRNVVLIIVDALRPMNMGIYGYARDTTPHLSSLAESGALHAVNGMRASCSESACGIFSIITSKYVHQFSSRPFSLYDVLRKYGYSMRLILGGDHTHFYGLRSLYGEVDSYLDGATSGAKYANDDRLIIDAANALPVWNGQPTAFQFHLMSAHMLAKRYETSEKFKPTVRLLIPGNRTPENKDKLTNSYDNGVVQADSIIFELLSVLREKHYLDDSLVVVTADHGEGLGEHQLFGHTKTVWDEVVRVPLAFIPYGFTPQPLIDQHAAVSQIDLAPTILHELGMGIPATWSGSPLQMSIERRFSFVMQGKTVGLIDDQPAGSRLKFWVDYATGKEYVFDLTKDPTETKNIAKTVDAATKKLWYRELTVLPQVTLIERPD